MRIVLMGNFLDRNVDGKNWRFLDLVFCARYYLASILVVLWLALFSSRYATVWGLFQRDVLNEVR